MATDPDAAEGMAEPDPAALADSSKLRDADPAERIQEPSDNAKLRHKGLEQFYGMRLNWSRWLIGWISILVVFQVVLTLAIGSGALDFRGYEGFLMLAVGQNFVQIVAMALVVVRFLHSRDKDETPL